MNSNETDCIFCKIVSGEIPATKVYEDGETLAFLDIRPYNHGHTLVIPKDHFENLYTLPAETLCKMLLIAQKLSLAVREATEADGIKIIMNNEPAGGQDVFHSHFHIVPCHQNDNWPHLPHKAYIGEEAKAIADKIKESLEK